MKKKKEISHPCIPSLVALKPIMARWVMIADNNNVSSPDLLWNQIPQMPMSGRYNQRDRESGKFADRVWSTEPPLPTPPQGMCASKQRETNEPTGPRGRGGLLRRQTSPLSSAGLLATARVKMRR